MRKIIYSSHLSSFFYIQQVKNKLLIVSIGPDSPFEFINVLSKAIETKAERIYQNEIEVYLDLLSCVGNNENRFSKLAHNKTKHYSIINDIQSISNEELPEDVSNELKSFYEKHINEAMRYSILSQKEKNNLSLSSIV